jgi:predicted nucleic acid-binding protein
MKGKYFLDTNFFVYLFNKTEHIKRDTCQQLLKSVDDSIQFVISTQVLNEFNSVMLNKFNMPPIVLKGIVDDMCEYEVVNTHVNLIKKAIDIKILNQISYWDSLIISAAKSANCSTIITEDMNDGQVIEGVKIQNPFQKTST